MPATLDWVKALGWQCIALAAKKYFFIISGAESAYGDDSLHKQTYMYMYYWIASNKGSLPEREPKFKEAQKTT